MRVLGVGLLQYQILLQRLVVLIVVEQILRQTADGVQVVMVQADGLFVGSNCVGVVFFLLVGKAQR